MKKTISIVIPVYNEKENILSIYRELEAVWLQLASYDHEYIFVNDGSVDASGEVISKLSSSDISVKYIEFSRNFGKEVATSAGIQASVGDAVIMIDADLQHPPSLIPALIAKWEQGSEVVVGLRTSNRGEGFVKSIGSSLFYKIMGLISETSMESGETDFRLLDRSVVLAFASLQELQRMTRSLINWLGFKKTFVPFESPARMHGKAQYSIQKLFNLAVYSFVTNSLKPLRFAGYLGFFITFFSTLLGAVVLVNRFVFGDPFGWKVSGSAQLAILNVFLVGIVLVALWIISLYVGNISTEVLRRPLYVVRKKINF